MAWTIGSFEILAVVVVVAAVATASAKTTWWIVVPSLILLPLVLWRLTLQAVRAGVGESSNGLVGQAGGYRSDFAWQEIAGFGYARLGARDVVVVRGVDGSRAVLRGSRRRMVWHDGSTDDFAALLEQRLKHFGDELASTRDVVA